MNHWLLSSGLASLLLLSLASGPAMADNQVPIAQASPVNTQTQEHPTGSSVAPAQSLSEQSPSSPPANPNAAPVQPTPENQAENTNINQSQSTVRGYW